MICNTIGLTADSFETIYTTGGTEVEEVYGAIDYAQPIYAKTREMTGTSPLTFTSRVAGTLTDYRIYGETLQDGTPSPDMPVDVVGCGEKTENLFDGYLEIGSFLAYDGKDYADPRLCRTDYIDVAQIKTYTASVPADCYVLYVGFYGTNRKWLGYVSNSTAKTEIYTFITPESTETIRIVFAYKNRSLIIVSEFPSDGIMLNEGSTALPHEPYVYKLPLTVNGTEYPIYLGQVPATRRIKKLVLTGEENFTINDFNNIRRFIILISPKGTGGIANPLYCSHFIYGYDFIFNHAYINISGNELFINREITESITDFKSFLATEYSAGHPVTIWYVLTEPETGIVNEPLHRIGEYADTIDFAQAEVTLPTTAGSNTLTVGTTVQPSAVSITGHIKPTGYGQLVDVNGVQILDKDNVPVFVHGQ